MTVLTVSRTTRKHSGGLKEGKRWIKDKIKRKVESSLGDPGKLANSECLYINSFSHSSLVADLNPWNSTTELQNPGNAG